MVSTSGPRGRRPHRRRQRPADGEVDVRVVLAGGRTLRARLRAELVRAAGMAKLFASETAMEPALDAVRVHGGHGHPTELDVERYFRDAPLMIVGEGTDEIQRNVIVGRLGSRGGLDA